MVNNEAFTREWVGAQAAVAAYLACHLRDRGTVDDLVQETALALLRSHERFEAGRDFTAWAIGTARHVLLDHMRASARTRQRTWDAAVLEQVAEAHLRLHDELEEQRLALRTCIDQLPQRQQDLLGQRYGAGVAIERIAQDLTASSATVRSWLKRLRDQLERCIRLRLAGDHG